MDKVIALTPIAPGTMLAPFSLGIPRLVSELAPSVRGRERNINMNRARLQAMYMHGYFNRFEFVLLLDSDVVITPDILDKLMEAWKPGTTPCAYTKGHETSHVCAACALVHRTDFAEINYLDKPFECQCTKVPKPFYVQGTEGGLEI